MKRMAAVVTVVGLLAGWTEARAAEEKATAKQAGKSPVKVFTGGGTSGTPVQLDIDDRNRAIKYAGKGWTDFEPGAGWHAGTAKSSREGGDCFEYTGEDCTRMKWFSTKGNSRGKAEVYVDGGRKATVDTYSAADQPGTAVFDSGELPPGKHAIKVVVLRQKQEAASDYWVECDKLEVTTTRPRPAPAAQPSPAPLPGAVVRNDGDASVLCFGNWQREEDQDGFRERDFRTCNIQHHACEFRFRGGAVRWIGAKNRDHGLADVYLDGVLQQTVDSYSPAWLSNVVLFEKTGLAGGSLHVLRIVVRKDRNPQATDSYQTIDCFEAAEPVNHVDEITRAAKAEYERIAAGAKPCSRPADWRPVAYAARAPENGVTLRSGVIEEALQRNIRYLNHCFASPTYSDGKDWFAWLPASNEGRLLQGAGNALRWGERADLRHIVNTVVARIRERQRADGYHNYYPEKDSFAAEDGANSERKNFDRVFWTRGLLDAGRAGNADAYPIVRRFYDWFNACPYLPRMIRGNNSPNGFPGGPLVYLSPVGKPDDLLVSERYLDQEWWLNELKNGEPLCFTFYPGERPHCYDLLGLEAYIDQYRATGAAKYLDAVRGGWTMYRENFQHVGGSTAICESNGPYPPKSYKLTTGCTGETCGSVFWININSRLMQLFPAEEKYAAEIEQAIYNVLLACQDANGFIRYHNRLHGTKEAPQCQGTCCESAAAGTLSKLPEFIYSTDRDGLWVNLFAASTITWRHDAQSMKVTQETGFPMADDVKLTISTAQPATMNLRIRVPSWATAKMALTVNDEAVATGDPGAYLSVVRKWADHDVVRFTLPVGFTSVKYTGLDQAPGNVDRHALLRGPVLLALDDADGRIHAEAASLPAILTAKEDRSLRYAVRGTRYHFVPYWLVEGSFTCFPLVQP